MIPLPLILFFIILAIGTIVGITTGIIFSVKSKPSSTTTTTTTIKPTTTTIKPTTTTIKPTTLLTLSSTSNTTLLKTFTASNTNFIKTLHIFGAIATQQIFEPENLINVIKIDVGRRHILALSDDGTVTVAGTDEGSQYVPITTDIITTSNVLSLIPRPSDLTLIKAIAAGLYHSLVLKEDGTVIAWGNNYHDQSTVPEGLNNVIAISAGGYHSLALKEDGTVIGWGKNDFGQITIPTNLTNVIAITAGTNHSLALKSDGTVVGWGDNSSSKATIPSDKNNNIKAISAGLNHSLALTNEGTVIVWGDNLYKQLDILPELNNITSIEAGSWHSLAVQNNKKLIVGGSYVENKVVLPDISDIDYIMSISSSFVFSAVLTIKNK